MIAAIAILTVTVYAALAVMAVRDARRKGSAVRDSAVKGDEETRRRPAARRDAARRREDASATPSEMTPRIRRRTPNEVREMVRLAINSHRPTIPEK